MNAPPTATISIPRIDDLPDDPSLLRGVLIQVLQVLATANGRIETLQNQVEQLTRRLYGRSSEKWDPNQTVMEDLLIPVLEQGPTKTAEPLVTPTIQVPSHTRKVTPHGRNVFPETLRHEEIIIPVPEAERLCPITGQERPVIGYEISKKLDYRKPELVVKVYKREKRGSVANAEEAGVVTAPVPECLVPKSVMDTGLLAHVVISKFEDHLPLYRQEKIFGRYGVALSRQTLCDNLMAAAEPLSLLSERVKAKILAGGLVHHDDTPVDLQAEGMAFPRSIKEARFWVSTVPAREGPWTYFQFTTSREAHHVDRFFKDYCGSLMTDDYAGYGHLPEAQIMQLRCWVHARRKFFEAQGSSPLEAAEVLERIRLLYKLEDSVDSDPRYDHQRALMRQDLAKPQLTDLRLRLEEWAGRTPPKSPLGKAIFYALNNWTYLIRYVENPRLPLDNNVAEQAIRPVALGRKNWLFMGSERGGQAAAVYMTLIATCKRAQVNSYEYFRDIFGRILSHSSQKLDDLLPDAWKVNSG
jgi:transposase